MRCALTLVLLATLAACSPKKEADNRSAEGEILPGSASDAMLPLDTVRSQPPLAPKSEIEASGKALPKDKASAAASLAPSVAAEPAGAPEPEPVAPASDE